MDNPLILALGRIRGVDLLEIIIISNDHAHDRHIVLSGAERLRFANHERTNPNAAQSDICQS
jgi:hypothetical protein